MLPKKHDGQGEPEEIGASPGSTEEQGENNEALDLWRTQIRLLSAAAHDAYSRNNLPALKQAMLNIDALRPEMQGVLQEDAATTYDTHLAYVGTRIAQCCNDRMKFELAYRVCEEVQSVLVAKRLRQRLGGRSAAPDSQAWIALLSVVAELKWKGPQKDLNRVMSVMELWLTYQQIVQHCIVELAGAAGRPKERLERLKDALSWCGLAVIKMVSIQMPEALDAAIKDYRQTFNVQLAEKPRDFQRGKPSGLSDPRYWDYELFKLAREPNPPQEDLLYCYQWRLDALRSGHRDDSQFKSYKEGARLELLALTGIDLTKLA